MEEGQVGIEVYTTSTSGFTGILKHRYSDFQVFEVDLAGKTAHLTDTSAPATEQQALPAAGAVLTDSSITELTAAFAGIAGAENAAVLKQLLVSIQQQQEQQGKQDTAAAAAAAAETAASSDQQQLEVDLLPVDNKEHRKAIHQFLKSDPRLPRLATDTVAAEGAAPGADGKTQHSTIRVRLAGSSSGGAGRGRGGGGGGGGKGQKRGRREWRDDTPWEGGQLKHVKFVMLKENMDTQAALTVIGRMLHVHSSAFGFAGTKDKRGVTTQFVTLLRTAPAKLAALNPKLRGIKLGDFGFCAGPLQLGQLRGNTFKILMRDVNTRDEQHIASAVSELREKGFINYFGLQRFGTGAVPTHRVGGALLRGEWEAAVQLVLQGSPDERPEYRAARDLYIHKRDIQGALKALPTFLVGERAILQSLAKSGPTNFLNALQGIPRTLRSMYLHAWQSWLWNRAASERIRRYGAAAAVAGDLVLLQQQQQQPQGADTGAVVAATEATAPSADAANDGPAEDQLAIDADEALDLASAAGRLESVHEVTAEEAAAGKYSIQDVVLPLPGGRVRYPSHEAGWKLYCQLAAEDGVLLPGMTAEDAAAAVAAAAAAAGKQAAAGTSDGDEPQQQQQQQQQQQLVSHAVKEFQLANLTGDYRKLLHVPSDMQHRVLHYSNPDQDDLLPSDWTELQRQQGPQHKRRRLEEQQQPEQPPPQQQTAVPAAPAAGSQQPEAGVKEALGTAEAAPGAAEAAGATDSGSAAAEQAPVVMADSAGPAAGTDKAPADEDASSHHANGQTPGMVGVVLEFTLPSSCYATMLIRELTKSSTSKASHREMSTKDRE